MWHKPTNAAIAIYSHGSKLENGDRGYAALTQVDTGLNRWKSTSAYIGENKQARVAELFGIVAGLELALCDVATARRD
ncbi:hypothetical protein FN846DRAFT_908588 [Sphaerosporella brunnea]|uniref:RNase H type-1 domain-containing protein n=1 Tax=Sphaerosporella brunnea TaxID=1250544 RepID=A0A5J5ESA1_9PEZI|nr:hypothetical protein FN846DRAFT_908588 [Sphaerosporella brunnea]